MARNEAWLSATGRADLEDKLASPGFTPGARDIDPLLSLLGAALDDDDAKRVERALARAGERSVRRATERFPDALPPLRARLCALVGRVFTESPGDELGEWLIRRLDDSDPKTARRAATALGKSRDARFEAPLLDAFGKWKSEPERRALVSALGGVGGERTLRELSTLSTDDAELGRVVREARMKIERTLVRSEPGEVRSDVAPRVPTDLLVHVRAGLEGLLIDELGAGWQARPAGRGRVAVSLARPLAELYRARTFLHVGFPLRPESLSRGDTAQAVVSALTSDSAMNVFQTFTRGPIRYRLDWASAGRRRRATFDVAARVRTLRPALVNDPTDAVWEAVVSEGIGADHVVRVELWPRGLDDRRFSYRRAVLPASSHPTVAAALARVAGATREDVVWDPFVGAGTELVERALFGPYAALYGTDVEQAALEAARENLRAAQVARVHLSIGDARTFGPPERPSLVITNPPFGRRVLRRDQVRPLLGAVVDNVASRLSSGGRLVWVSPMPRVTLELARAAGFSVGRLIPVDLGGVSGEIQEFVLRARRGAERPSRRKL